jgi:hypothetical protein
VANGAASRSRLRFGDRIISVRYPSCAFTDFCELELYNDCVDISLLIMFLLVAGQSADDECWHVVFKLQHMGDVYQQQVQ